VLLQGKGAAALAALFISASAFALDRSALEKLASDDNDEKIAAIAALVGGSVAMTTHVTKAGTRAAGLTRQLLAFSRLQSLNPSDLDVNAVVDRSSRGLRPRTIHR